MVKRKKQTENQKAYQKERRRLLQAVRRAEKQGYIFPEDIVPVLPKRVTKKQLEKIQKIKPKQLYKKAEFVYQETGETVPAEQRKQEVKQEAIKKAKETRKRHKKIRMSRYYPTISIIDKIRDRISELTREAKPPIPIENRKNELLSIFDDNVTTFEDNIIEYEHYLEEHESEIAELLNVISYDSNAEQISASFVSLGRILNMQSLSMSQAENLSIMAEYYNS
jgi:hypothetical protein|nr:MAG TPA: hypothetical protein [Caudoviricetes sp.]